MKIAKTTVVKLTEREYRVLKEAANITDNIIAEIDDNDFEEDYDLRDVGHIISAFLKNDDVYVVWE